MTTRSDDDSIPLMPASVPTTPGRIAVHSPAHSNSTAPWPIEEWLERESAKYPIPRSRMREVVDFNCLVYPESPDENLLCPICKVPFVTAVTTPCDHTFCFDCIKQSCESTNVCPVDREPFRPKHVKPASRLLRNQLDSLVVECPNAERGCADKVKREDVVMHAHKCTYTLTRCPDDTCQKKVVQWLAESRDECLHHEEACPYCDAQVEVASMHEHVNKACTRNSTNCESCHQTLRKSDVDLHNASQCPEAEAPCEFAEYGCTHSARRKQLNEHRETCAYRICTSIGQMVKVQATQIERLQRDNAERDRQIWELKQEQKRGGRSEFWEDLRIHPYGPKYRTAEEAVMGIYEQVERRIECVKKDLTDLDGRQTVMVLNELMPIKNEITEIRSNLGILKMHVAWLMNKSREEVERNRLANRVVGGSPAAAAASAAATLSSAAGTSGSGTGRGRGGSDSEADGPSTSRRLSDGSNGIPRL